MDNLRLAKADTVALWHAVANYDLMVRQMAGMDFREEQIQAERARVQAAKRALRQVNAIRRASLAKKGERS